MLQAGRPTVALAPMEGVTDAPMRAFLTELGGFSYCVSEFYRVSQNVPSSRTFPSHIPELRTDARTGAGTPVQVQLLGGDPERLAAAALNGVEAGARAIDLNFGCPAKTVNRHDGGATLLQHPERIEAIVRAVRSAVPREIPVSAKLRLGWDNIDDIHRNADAAIEGGADWLTVHARTKTQGYRPPAYWGPIGILRARSPIPIVANGEIWTLDDFRRCRDETRCDHYMLGRGALANPWLGRLVEAELKGLAPPDTDALSWPQFVDRFLAHALPFSDRPRYAVCRLKQWLHLARDTQQAAYDALKFCETLPEVLALVHSDGVFATDAPCSRAEEPASVRRGASSLASGCLSAPTDSN